MLQVIASVVFFTLAAAWREYRRDKPRTVTVIGSITLFAALCGTLWLM